MRPLPGLLKNQRLFSGVTLSGTGDIMLLFDSQRLLERGMQLAQAPSESPADNAAPRRPASTDRDSRRRALIVDDSRSARRTLVQCLTPRGWVADEANDGLQALKLLRSHTYDLVLTDLEMPQLGGMELLREIRAQRQHTGSAGDHRHQPRRRQAAKGHGSIGSDGLPDKTDQ